MKLTLSARTDVIKEAKRLAKRHRTSVSAMFERIVRAMAEKEPGKRSIGPLTRKATGVIGIPKGKTERQLIEEALSEKYGARR
jgi:hypothetical protein